MKYPAKTGGPASGTDSYSSSSWCRCGRLGFVFECRGVQVGELFKRLRGQRARFLEAGAAPLGIQHQRSHGCLQSRGIALHVHRGQDANLLNPLVDSFTVVEFGLTAVQLVLLRLQLVGQDLSEADARAEGARAAPPHLAAK